MSLTRTLMIDVRPLRTSPVFRRLLIGRTVSTLGSFMTMVTVMYQVWDMTHSSVWSGAVGLAQALPVIGQPERGPVRAATTRRMCVPDPRPRHDPPDRP